MTDRPGGLGRLVSKDLRDLSFLMCAARPLADQTPKELLPSAKHYTRGPVLDQGETGTCTAHALVAKLRGRPVVVNPPRCPDPMALYDREIAIDEFPENDHDTAR